MILLVDNYDSFTYNLYHYLAELGADVVIKRNDAITIDEIASMEHLKGVVISPGPCTPNDAGICLDLVSTYHKTLPIFGVCLGHQSIAQAFGGKIIQAKKPVHGKVMPMVHEGRGVFKDIPSPFNATRYHSLLVEESSLPECFSITCKTQDDGIIMGIEHKEFPIFGVQFHPESIASDHGHTLLRNFLDITGC